MNKIKTFLKVNLEILFPFIILFIIYEYLPDKTKLRETIGSLMCLGLAMYANSQISISLSKVKGTFDETFRAESIKRNLRFVLSILSVSLIGVMMPKIEVQGFTLPLLDVTNGIIDIHHTIQLALGLIIAYYIMQFFLKVVNQTILKNIGSNGSQQTSTDIEIKKEIL